MKDSEGRIQFDHNNGSGIQFMRDAGLLDEKDQLILSEYMKLPPIDEEEDDADKIIGADTRIQILNPSLGTAPYHSIVRLSVRKGNRLFRGSGFLVKEDVVVTAGHCYCWKENAQTVMADDIGVTQILSASLNQTAAVINGKVDPIRNYEQTKENDWAILKIDRSLGDNQRIMPVMNGSHLSRGSQYLCEIAGYPSRAQGRITADLWYAQGPIRIPIIGSSEILTYEISTSGGQSGAPVFMDYNGIKTAIGIHLGYTNSCCQRANYCRKIDDALYREILRY